MNLYEIGHYSPEGGDRVYLANERPYTQKEFEDLVIKLTTELAKKSVNEWHGKKDEAIASFDMLVDDVIRLLIERHGFTRPEIKGSVYEHGWQNVVVEDCWDQESIFFKKVLEDLDQDHLH